MKILLAPSKTKNLVGQGEDKLFNENITKEIVASIRALTPEELAKAMKLDVAKAQVWQDFYGEFPNLPKGKAISSYNGLVFKRLAYENLSGAGQKFCHEHLRILSALYGVVEPQQNIVNYRLDLVDNIYKEKGKNLTKVWTEQVSAYFQGEDWLLNLASKEYAKLIKHPKLVTVEFLDLVKGKYRQSSTRSKEMRGLLANYVMEQGILEFSKLPRELGDYELGEPLPQVLEDNLVLRYYKKE